MPAVTKTWIYQFLFWKLFSLNRGVDGADTDPLHKKVQDKLVLRPPSTRGKPGTRQTFLGPSSTSLPPSLPLPPSLSLPPPPLQNYSWSDARIQTVIFTIFRVWKIAGLVLQVCRGKASSPCRPGITQRPCPSFPWSWPYHPYVAP